MEHPIHRPRSSASIHGHSHFSYLSHPSASTEQLSSPPPPLSASSKPQNAYPPQSMAIHLPANPPMFDSHTLAQASHHQQQQQHHHHQQQQQQQGSYMPEGLIPPGQSAAVVNFLSFAPYLPHEVKHRKRTSRTQFKILEETFRIDPKPNLALRKKLSAELEMSPRAVQVWFQNRRSKEKNLAKKAAEHKGGVASIGDLDAEYAPTHLGRELSRTGSGSDSDSDSPSGSAVHSRANSDAAPPPPQLLQSPVPPLSAPAAGFATLSPLPPHAASAPFFRGSPEPDLLLLRRGSLPAIVAPPDIRRAGPSPPGGFPVDPLGRRRSVDHSLHRLAAHPYAGLARAANNGVYGARPSGLAAPDLGAGAVFLHPHARRPILSHRASMPHALHAQFAAPAHDAAYLAHRGSVDSAASAHDAPPVLSARTRLLDGSLYAVSARTVSSPIPGPLPEESFTFGSGAPSPLGAAGADLGSQLSAFAFPSREADEGTASSSAASFDAYSFESRFGSIASIAESEASSATSAFYSDASGACFDAPEVEYPSGFAPDLRKESCTSLYDGFSSLRVDAHAGQDDGSHHMYGSSDESLAIASGVALPSDNNNPSPVSDPNGSTGGSAYPSPGASTVSPGHSPPAMSRVASQEGLQGGALMYALQDAHGQQMMSGGGSSSGHGSPNDFAGMAAAAAVDGHALYGHHHQQQQHPQASGSDGLYGGGMYQQPGGSGSGADLTGAGAYHHPYGAHAHYLSMPVHDAWGLGADGKVHGGSGAEYAAGGVGLEQACAVDYSEMGYQLP